MRLITFERDGEQRSGTETAKGIVDFAEAAPSLPRTLLGLLAAGPDALQTARAAVTRALENGRGLVPPDAVRLLAPLPRPGKIFGIAINYAAHAAETERDAPPAPIVFSKAGTAVVGPGAAIELPTVSREVDFEGELALVIGSTAKRVSRHDALAKVAGYTIMNDVTARDVQKLSGHCLGKSFDTFAPMGPAVVTLDEFADPLCLDIRTVVSGEEMQNGNTRQMIFDIPKLIEYISAGVTLEPGDLITTGTPSGVGARRNPPRFLRAGDVVRVEVQGIGALENPVAGPTA